MIGVYRLDVRRITSDTMKLDSWVITEYYGDNYTAIFRCTVEIIKLLGERRYDLYIFKINGHVVCELDGRVLVPAEGTLG